MNFIRLPVASWVDSIVGLLLSNFQSFFRLISSIISAILGGIENILLSIPAFILLAILAFVVWRIANWRTGLFTLVGLLLIGSLGLWKEGMVTLALVSTATFISLMFGLPLGIISAGNQSVRSIMRPLLDVMQTMPSFVYLIPAMMFFGIGRVPGAVATVIFSMPPAIRLTQLGILQVPEDVVEAGQAFGATRLQLLTRIQLPLAMPSIMAGINQTILLSLSMVVIAAMIGAGGLGSIVVRALSRVQIGLGFEGGLAVVLMAMILDRITQNLGQKD